MSHPLAPTVRFPKDMIEEYRQEYTALGFKTDDEFWAHIVNSLTQMFRDIPLKQGIEFTATRLEVIRPDEYVTDDDGYITDFSAMVVGRFTKGCLHLVFASGDILAIQPTV